MLFCLVIQANRTKLLGIRFSQLGIPSPIVVSGHACHDSVMIQVIVVARAVVPDFKLPHLKLEPIAFYYICHSLL